MRSTKTQYAQLSSRSTERASKPKGNRMWPFDIKAKKRAAQESEIRRLEEIQRQSSTASVFGIVRDKRRSTSTWAGASYPDSVGSHLYQQQSAACDENMDWSSSAYSGRGGSFDGGGSSCDWSSSSSSSHSSSSSSDSGSSSGSSSSD